MSAPLQQIVPGGGVYGASTIKRVRRTKSAIASIREAIHEVLAEANPQTVRQVFYALTVRGVIKKAEAEYQRTVIRLLTEMRGRARSRSTGSLTTPGG